MEIQLKSKYQILRDNIKKLTKVGVAFSGGVDSTLLLNTCYDILGKNVIAYFAQSQAQPKEEVEHVKAIAEKIGCRFKIIDFDLLSDQKFCQNKDDRCYYCKKNIYKTFIADIYNIGFDQLLDGTNLDDTKQNRPGAQAIAELQVGTPLVTAQLSKRDIRLISKEIGLDTWGKHSASCLATRIFPNQLITIDKLNLVYQLENVLKHEGFYGCRVKIADKFIVVCLLKDDFNRFIYSEIAEKLKKIIKTKGLEQVFLDLSAREGILT